LDKDFAGLFEAVGRSMRHAGEDRLDHAPFAVTDLKLDVFSVNVGLGYFPATP
jgi:hypothetical protein